MPFNALCILGPTASGKTKLAVDLAVQLGGEILSIDSRQVYKDLSLAVGKDHTACCSEESIPPVIHLIDITNVDAPLHVDQFRKYFFQAYQQVQSKNKIPILCGGSGLYLEILFHQMPFASIPLDATWRSQASHLTDKTLQKIWQKSLLYEKNILKADTRNRIIRAIEIHNALQNGWEPAEYETLDASNTLFIGLNPSPESRRTSISERLQRRLSHGMLQEIESLLQQGIAPEVLKKLGLECLYLTKIVLGEISYNDGIQQLEHEIHRYAKRQMTYFRKLERIGWKVHWFHTVYTGQATVLDSVSTLWKRY